jgi:hypothetical protein
MMDILMLIGGLLVGLFRLRAHAERQTGLGILLQVPGATDLAHAASRGVALVPLA